MVWLTPGVFIVLAALVLHQLPILPDYSSSSSSISVGIGVTIAAVSLFVLARNQKSEKSHGIYALLRQALVTLLWAVIFLLWAILRSQLQLDARLPQAEHGRQIVATVQVIGLPNIDSLPRPSWRFSARIVDSESAQLRGKTLQVVWGGADLPSELESGSYWKLPLQLRGLYGTQNPVWSGPAPIELKALEQGLFARASVKPAGGILPEEVPADSLENLSWSLLAMIDRQRSLIRRAMLTAMQQDHARVSGVQIALVMGDQSLIAPLDWAIFNRTGIGHLISISGLHVTMIAAFGGVLASLSWAVIARYLVLAAPRLARVLQWQLSRGLMFRISAVIWGGAYCLFAGAEIPAQRTFWMLLALAIASSLRRRTEVKNALLFAAAVVLWIDPWAIASPGFWLSFVATWVLIVGASAVKEKSKWAHIKSAAKSQLLITVALIPLSAWFFGKHSWISPFANALAIPWVSFVTTPLSLLGAAIECILPNSPIAWWSWKLSAISVEWLHEYLQWLEQCLDGVPATFNLLTPGDPLTGVLFFLASLGAITIVLADRRYKRLLGVALLGLLFVPELPRWKSSENLEVYVPDIGNSSAVLVLGKNFSLLYDTGIAANTGPGGFDAVSRAVLPYLRERSIKHLDWLVLSHADRDHVGGLTSVLAALPVNNIVHALPSELDQSAPAVLDALKRNNLTTNQANILDCSKAGKIQPDQLKSSSLSLQFHYVKATNHRLLSECVALISQETVAAEPGFKVALLGDLSLAGQVALASELTSNQPNQIVLMQLPGQGAKKSLSPAFAKALAPQHVFAQLTPRHFRNYPSEQVKGILNTVSSSPALWRTDCHGGIRLVIHRADDGKGSVRPKGYTVDSWSERRDAPRYFNYPVKCS